MELLKMKDICKSFSGVPVLKKVHLTVEKGEVHALLGENGAGKSTLMNVLTGVCPLDAGEIVFDGKAVENITIRHMENAGISFVHQELNLFNDLKAYENIFLGREYTNRVGTLQAGRMRREASDLFEKLGVEIDPNALVCELKPSQKQLLEIARALFFEAKLLILDEPTTALNTEEVEHLFSLVRKLKAQGTSFIFISHKMPEIFELCDRYTVFRNGEFVGEGQIAQTTPQEVTGLMVGGAFNGQSMYTPRPAGEPVLELTGYCGPGFHDIDLCVKRGQIIGLTGLQGCGSSELMQCVFGALPAGGGSINVFGKPLAGGSIHEAMKAGVAMLPANRKENSVIPDATLLENMYLSEHTLSAARFQIHQKAEQKRFLQYQSLLGIRAQGSDGPITALSGGNQQKVFLARWLNTQAELLLLDNPTQGIDVGAKAEIYRLIFELAGEGKTILINTLEIPEIQKVADVCAVFYNGRIIQMLSHGQIDEHTVMLYSTGAAGGEKKQSVER